MLIEEPRAKSVPGASTADEVKSGAWIKRAFLPILLILCGLAAFAGAAPVSIFGHDIFFFLDNSYRVLQGQIPHRDFGSAWGILTYVPDAVGLAISGMRPDGIGYGSAVFGFVLGYWAYAVARKRMSAAASAIVGVYTALLIVAPFSLGYGPLHFSHAMAYNRYGFALLGIIFVESALSSREDSWGISTGVAWALLFFIKITYALAALPLLLVAAGSSLWRKQTILWMGGAAAGTALVVLLYLRFDVRDLAGDLIMAASGRSRSWKPVEILRLGFGQFGETVPLILLTIAVGKPRIRWAAVALATLGLQGFLLSACL